MTSEQSGTDAVLIQADDGARFAIPLVVLDGARVAPERRQEIQRLIDAGTYDKVVLLRHQHADEEAPAHVHAETPEAPVDPADLIDHSGDLTMEECYELPPEALEQHRLEDDTTGFHTLTVYGFPMYHTHMWWPGGPEKPPVRGTTTPIDTSPQTVLR